MEDDNKPIIMSKEGAYQQLKQLGYNSLEGVPVGRGNDYLTALKNLATGRYGDEGIDINIAVYSARQENALLDDTRYKEALRRLFK